MTVQAFTKLEPRLEAPLRALFAARGIADLYESRLKAAFSPGPALLCAAMAAENIRAAMYAVPADSESAEASAIVIDRDDDARVLAALWKTMMEQLRSLGMRRLHYEIERNSPAAAAALRRCGFRKIQGRFSRPLDGSGLSPDDVLLLQRIGGSFPQASLHAPVKLTRRGT